MIERSRAVQLAAATLACLLLASACGGGATRASKVSHPEDGVFGDHIVIGNAVRLTGPLADNALVDGVTAAINDVNRSGGIDGRKLQLVNVDTQSTAPGEVAAYKELTGVDHALAVIGSGNSSGSAAVLPLLDAAKVPYIVGGASLYGEGGIPFNPYYYTNQSTYADQVSIALAFGEQELKSAGVTKPRVAVVTIDSSAGQEWTALTKERVMRAGWTWLGNQTIPATAVDATAVAQILVGEKPDLISLMGNTNTMTLLNKALAPTSLRPFEVSGFGNMVESAMPQIPAAFQPKMAWVNTYAPLYADSPFQGALAARKSAIRNGYSKDLSVYGFGPNYASGLLLIAALKAAGPDVTRASLVKALDRVHDLSTGNLSPAMSLSTRDHEAVHGALPYTWDGGKAEFVSHGSYADWSKYLAAGSLNK